MQRVNTAHAQVYSLLPAASINSPAVDTRYQVITSNVRAKIVQQHGRCPICVHDLDLPWHKRMLQYDVGEELLRHLHSHFVELWAATKDDPDMLFACYDVSCALSHARLVTLSQLFSRIRLHHFACPARLKAPSTIVATDWADFEKQLRILYIPNASQLAVVVGVVTTPTSAAGKKALESRLKGLAKDRGDAEGDDLAHEDEQPGPSKGKDKAKTTRKRKRRNDDDDAESSDDDTPDALAKDSLPGPSQPRREHVPSGAYKFQDTDSDDSTGSLEDRSGAYKP
jgi:hypothetical protein